MPGRELLLAVAMLACACEGVKKQNRPLPEDFHAVTLTDQLLDRSTLAGQPWVISVWRPGCAPCMRQLQVLDKVKAKNASRQIGFVALSLETDEQAIFEAAGKAEIDSTLAWGEEVMGPLGLRSVPSTVFLDSSAVIVASFNGERDEATIEKWMEVAAK